MNIKFLISVVLLTMGVFNGVFSFPKKRGARFKERTLIMVKPDGVQRGLVGKIIQTFEQKGLKLVAIKFLWATEDQMKKHYNNHKDKSFFLPLIKYMTSAPVVPMVWEGLQAIRAGRVLMGANKPMDSVPGTIRGDLCIQTGRNVVHGSDSINEANREIGLWFNQTELVEWDSILEPWIYTE